MRTPLGWRIPIPAASHLIPLERVRYDVTAGRTTFLMGQYSQRGWWYYFPVAFAIKTPLPMLFLLLIAILSFTLRSARTKQWGGWNTLALAIFPVGLLCHRYRPTIRYWLPPPVAHLAFHRCVHRPPNFQFQISNAQSQISNVLGIWHSWPLVHGRHRAHLPRLLGLL
jgi:hypothetical protein